MPSQEIDQFVADATARGEVYATFVTSISLEHAEKTLTGGDGFSEGDFRGVIAAGFVPVILALDGVTYLAGIDRSEIPGN